MIADIATLYTEHPATMGTFSAVAILLAVAIAILVVRR